MLDIFVIDFFFSLFLTVSSSKVILLGWKRTSLSRSKVGEGP